MRAYFLVALLAVTITVATNAAAPQSSKSANPASARSASGEDCAIAGMVVKLAGSEPLRNAIVVMQNTDDPARAASTVHADSSGRFLLKGIPRDVLTDGFTPRVVPGATLEITLSSRGAHVQGSAADADGLPAVGVWVVLVPEGKGRERPELYKTAQTDQHGQFQIRGVAPGDYKLFSWDEVERGAWEDPDFLKIFEEKGEKVSVQEGDSKSFNVTSIRTVSAEEQKP